MTKLNLLLKAIGAGMLIAIGCIAKLVIENPVVGAFIFSLGLFFICCLNLNLYTGKIAYINNNNYQDYPIIWIGNLIGAGAVMLPYRYVNHEIIHIAHLMFEAKVNRPLLSNVFLGIMCGILMYLAVDNYRNNKNDFARILGIIFGVMGFILCGFEHSIADVGYAFLAVEDYWEILVYFLLVCIITVSNSIGSVVFYHLIKEKGNVS